MRYFTLHLGCFLIAVAIVVAPALAADKEPKVPAKPMGAAKPSLKLDMPTAPVIRHSGPPLVLGKVVASIDGEPITSADLARFMAAQGKLGQGADAQRVFENSDIEAQKSLKDLVLSRVLAKEAQKNNVSVSDDEISAYITEIKKHNNVDEQGFNDLLKSRNLTLESYKKQVGDEIVRSRLIATQIRTKVTVLEDEIDQYLADHPQEVPDEDAVRVKQIFLPTNELSDADRESLKEKAEEYREALKDGASWESTGGANYTDLGYMALDDLMTQLHEALEPLQPGEVSEVVDTPNGFYLLTYSKAVPGAEGEERTEAQRELRDSIREKLFQNKMKGDLEKYITEDLPKKYDIEYKL